jgi:hypothetical protein
VESESPQHEVAKEGAGTPSVRHLPAGGTRLLALLSAFFCQVDATCSASMFESGRWQGSGHSTTSVCRPKRRTNRRARWRAYQRRLDWFVEKRRLRFPSGIGSLLTLVVRTVLRVSRISFQAKAGGECYCSI